MAFHRYFVREDDKEEHIKKRPFQTNLRRCGAAITRKGDIATHIALINAQMRSFAIFGVIKFSGVFCWVMSVKCLIFLVLLKFSVFCSLQYFSMQLTIIIFF